MDGSSIYISICKLKYSQTSDSTPSPFLTAPWHVSWLIKAIFNFIFSCKARGKLSVPYTNTQSQFCCLFHLSMYNFLHFVTRNCSFLCLQLRSSTFSNFLQIFEKLDIYLSLNLVHCPVPQHWTLTYSRLLKPSIDILKVFMKKACYSQGWSSWILYLHLGTTCTIV